MQKNECCTFYKKGEIWNCINNMLQEIGTFCNSYFTFSSRNLFAYKIFENTFHPSFKYTRGHIFAHTIYKVQQWLAWLSEFWVGHGWSYILPSWGPFLYSLAISMPIFKKKYLRRFLDKIPKLFIVVTFSKMQFYF